MPETLQESIVKCRGTILLEEFERSLPNFNNLSEEQHSEFIKAIHLLNRRFRLTEGSFDKDNIFHSEQILDLLKQLHKQYLDEKQIIAAAILVVITHIESYHLDDSDAKLVHNLTGLQISRPIPLGSPVRSSIRMWLNRVRDRLADIRSP
jgi:hypothetical protein